MRRVLWLVHNFTKQLIVKLLQQLAAHWPQLQFRHHRLTLFSTSWYINVKKGVENRSLTWAATNEHNGQTDMSVVPDAYA